MARLTRPARLRTTNLFVRQHPIELRRVRIRHLARAAHLALRLRRLARQDVTLECGSAHDLARARLLEPLGGTPMCLEFRHLVIPRRRTPRRPPEFSSARSFDWPGR